MSAARHAWKIWYRQLRIIRRECKKAELDMLLFGTGCVMLKNEPDYIEYMPLERLQIKDARFILNRS